MLWSWILKQSNLEKPRAITSFRLVNEPWNQILAERDIMHFKWCGHT